MREYPGNLDPSKARNLAVFGAMVTGVVGVGMAIFSVVGGEEAGGAGLGCWQRRRSHSGC